jgi:hypothetical protein
VHQKKEEVNVEDVGGIRRKVFIKLGDTKNELLQTAEGEVPLEQDWESS